VQLLVGRRMMVQRKRGPAASQNSCRKRTLPPLALPASDAGIVSVAFLRRGDE